MDSLWPLLIPVLASTLILVAGAWVVRRYAGPAQQQYTAAIEGRMKVLTSERDDLSDSLSRLKDEVQGLRTNVAELERTVKTLERQVRDLTAENLELLRINVAATLESERVARAIALETERVAAAVALDTRAKRGAK
jgi:predicted nuclease with TOPRIM domain